MVWNHSKLPDYSAEFKKYPISIGSVANGNRGFPRHSCTLRQQENPSCHASGATLA
jgi:hypothetical protein